MNLEVHQNPFLVKVGRYVPRVVSTVLRGTLNIRSDELSSSPESPVGSG